MSAIQSSVDQLVAEHLRKQRELELEMLENSKPQPFSQVLLVQFFVDEFNSRHEEPLTDEERKVYGEQIASEIVKVMKMTLGEVKNYFKAYDEQKTNEIVKFNEQVVFDYCLIKEVSKLGLSGDERDSFREKRIRSYREGTFDYTREERQSQEIIIRMEDIHFPEGSKKLKDVSFMPTFELLIEKQSKVKDGSVKKKIY